MGWGKVGAVARGAYPRPQYQVTNFTMVSRRVNVYLRLQFEKLRDSRISALRFDTSCDFLPNLRLGRGFQPPNPNPSYNPHNSVNPNLRSTLNP